MPKKKRQPRKKVDKRLNNFERAFRSTKRPWKVINSHRQLLGKENFAKAWEIIRSDPRYHRFLKKWYLPDSLQNLVLFHPGTTLTLADELLWAGECIYSFRKEVAKFLELRNAFEACVSTGDYEGARNALNRIEQDVCRSFWATERLIGVSQKSEGFEGNKRFVEPIIENEEIPAILRHVVQQLSIRNEENTPIIWQFSEYKKSVQGWDLNSRLIDFIKYKVFRPLVTGLDFADIMQSESGVSIIDLYETFVFVLCQFLKSEQPEAREEVARIITKLVSGIPDVRLDKLLFLISGDPASINHIPIRHTEVMPACHQGNRARAIALAREVAVVKEIALVDAIECAKVFFDEQVSLDDGGELIPLIMSVLDKRDSFIDAYNTLVKASTNCAPQYDEHLVSNFLATEFMGVPLHDAGGLDLAEFIYSPYLAYSHVALMRSPGVKSQLLELLDTKCNEFERRNLYRFMGAPIADQPHLDHLSEDYRQLAQIEMSSLTGEITERTQMLQLAESERLRLRRYGGRYLANQMLQEYEFEALFDFLGTRLMEDVGAKFTLPMKDIGLTLTKEVRRSFSHRIELPIILTVIEEFGEVSDDRRLLYAYEDFLHAQGVQKPTQIPDLEDKLRDPKMCFFLRHVCSIETLSNSIAFESNREVEDERLRICAYLIFSDPENADAYDEEIEQISKKQAVDTVISQVEQSKIYVDTSSIRDWAMNELRPSFARYIKYLQSGMAGGAAGLSDDIISKFLKNDPGADELLSEAPKNEAYQILVEILRRLLTKFFLDSLHGLDSYLSVRVRHGSISSQLREPFSQNGLITQKITGAEEYEENELWSNTFPDSPERQKKLDIALCKFSSDVDGLIERISKEYIQVRSDEHPKGLLVAVLTNVQVRLFASQVDAETSLEEFLEAAFDVFWTIADHGLSNIRAFIRERVSLEFDELFEGLEKQVFEISNGKSPSNLSARIQHAKTEMSIALLRFEEWFQRTTVDAVQQVNIDDIAVAALTSVRRARYTNFDPQLEIDGDGGIGVFSGQISFFNDVFFIIFENVMKHSGLSGAFSIYMKVEWLDNRLNFLVENDLSDDVDLDQRRAELREIEESMLSDGFLEKVSKEGKSGLLKLQKILGGVGTGFDPMLRFSVNSNPRKFRVSFSMQIIEAMNDATSTH